jgi:hypothetical protein
VSRFTQVPVEVSIGACTCPRMPHAEDVVYLAPRLSLAGGMAAQADILAVGADVKALTVAWTETFIRYGVTGWNLTDAKGKPEPLDIAPLLADYTLAEGIADKAIELYRDQVLDPLTRRLGTTSLPGPTDGSTSAVPQSPGSPPESSSEPDTAGTLSAA